MRINKLSDDEKRNAALMAVAKAAAELNTKADAMEIVLEGIRKIPEQIQRMVDTVVAMQDEFPMPQEGWNQFVKDIEYTNKKHGLNLQIKDQEARNGTRHA